MTTTHEEWLTTYRQEFDLLGMLDLPADERAVQAFQATSVRQAMAGGRPVRWTFGGKISVSGNVISMAPNRTETHQYSDDGRDLGTWPGDTWPSDEDTEVI